MRAGAWLLAAAAWHGLGSGAGFAEARRLISPEEMEAEEPGEEAAQGEPRGGQSPPPSGRLEDYNPS